MYLSIEGGYTMERISVHATIDFSFEPLPETDTTEMIADLLDRIARAEFLPSDIQHITITISPAANAG